MDEKFDQAYFTRHQRRGRLLRGELGDKPAFNAFWIRFLARRLKRGDRVLEVGCGLGAFLRRMERAYNAVGLDISEVALREAARRTSMASLVRGLAEQLPFADSHFATVVAFDVIEHLSEPDRLIREVARVLNPGGIFILSTPNPRSLGAGIKRPPLKSFIQVDPTHISVRTPQAWRSCMAAAGFQVVRDGTDVLWDLPYTGKVPTVLQKAVLVPLNVIGQYCFGFFRWSLGENYVCVATKAIR